MQYALSASNINKKYANGTEALSDLNLNVETGDFFALLGPNGAGKSTFINIITTLTNKDSGSITINDYDLDKNPLEAKCSLGIVPQEFNFHIFETVSEIILNQAGYLGINRSEAKEWAEFCINKMELWDKRNQQSRNLSGGMKRRLMIARALVHKPKLLILDEPTAGVDIEIRHSMWKFLKEINQDYKTTIILTTHYLEEAEKLCNNFAIINKGKILKQAPIHSLHTELIIEKFNLFFKKNKPNTKDISHLPCTIINNEKIELSLPRDKSLSNLIIELHKSGYDITSIENKSSKLEELFINIIHNTNKNI